MGHGKQPRIEVVISPRKPRYVHLAVVVSSAALIRGRHATEFRIGVGQVRVSTPECTGCNQIFRD